MAKVCVRCSMFAQNLRTAKPILQIFPPEFLWSERQMIDFWFLLQFRSRCYDGCSCGCVLHNTLALAHLSSSTSGCWIVPNTTWKETMENTGTSISLKKGKKNCFCTSQQLKFKLQSVFINRTGDGFHRWRKTV